MGLIKRIFGQAETRAVQTSDPYIAEFFGQGGSGLAHVDPARASGTAVAHRCITLISEVMASVPLFVYRHGDRGSRERATDHPAYGVLHDEPNAQMTAFELRERLIAGLLSHGNAYAEISRNGRGQVIGLACQQWNRSPPMIRVSTSSKRGASASRSSPIAATAASPSPPSMTPAL